MVPDVLKELSVHLGMHVVGAFHKLVANKAAHGSEEDLPVNTCSRRREELSPCPPAPRGLRQGPAFPRPPRHSSLPAPPITRSLQHPHLPPPHSSGLLSATHTPQAVTLDPIHLQTMSLSQHLPITSNAPVPTNPSLQGSHLLTAIPTSAQRAPSLPSAAPNSGLPPLFPYSQ